MLIFVLRLCVRMKGEGGGGDNRIAVRVEIKDEEKGDKICQPLSVSTLLVAF